MERAPIPFRRFLPGIAWFFIVALLTLLPGKDVPEVHWFDNIFQFDKLVHAVLFGGLAFLFSVPYFRARLPVKHKTNAFIRITLACIIWGITVEFIQKFFIPGRDFELMDWAADTIGALISLWLCIRIRKKYFAGNQASRV